MSRDLFTPDSRKDLDKYEPPDIANRRRNILVLRLFLVGILLAFTLICLFLVNLNSRISILEQTPTSSFTPTLTLIPSMTPTLTSTPTHTNTPTPTVTPTVYPLPDTCTGTILVNFPPVMSDSRDTSDFIAIDLRAGMEVTVSNFDTSRLWVALILFRADGNRVVGWIRKPYIQLVANNLNCRALNN